MAREALMLAGDGPDGPGSETLSRDGNPLSVCLGLTLLQASR